MLKKLKNNNGFSLLEIIISVAAISLVGVFIVQMFISSSTLNKRAKAVDMARTQASSMIEQFKASEVMPEENIHHEYYNKNWGKLDSRDGSEKYSLYVRIYKGTTDEAVGELYSMGIEIVEFVDSTKGSESIEKALANLETKKYFPKSSQ